MKDKILEALGQFDPLNDEQWTSDGAPRVDAVEAIIGENVTRQMIVDAAPDFDREKAGEGGDPAVVDPVIDPDEDQVTTTDESGTDDEQSETQTDPDPEGGDDDAQEDPEGEQGRQEALSTLVEVDEPMTEKEFAEFLMTVDKHELEDVEKMLKLQMGEAQADAEKIKDLVLRLKRGISLTRSRIKQEFPNSTNTEATRAFINSQTEQRAAKVARRKEILKGIDVKDLDPRAPIDAAMARKTKRGGKRPQRQLMR